MSASAGNTPRPPVRRTRRLLRAAALTMAAALPLVPTGAGTLGLPMTEAAASTETAAPVPLPLRSVTDMVVDDAHYHLFFAGWDGTNGVVLVTDLEGKVVTILAKEPGPGGPAHALALSPDGSRLYVSFGYPDLIEFDTATLKETRQFSIPNASAIDLAAAGDRLWFTYCCNSSNSTGPYGLGSVDLSSSDPTVRTDHVAGLTMRQRLSVAGSRLALGGETERVTTYDISTGEATALATRQVSYNFRDLALTHDGEQLITVVTGSAGPGHQVWNADDLSPAGSYATNGIESAVALSEDDSLVAAGATNGRGDDVWVYRAGETTPLQSVELSPDGTAPVMVTGGLAFTADQSRLFAVSAGGEPETTSLHVIRDPWRYDSHLTVDAPTYASLGNAVTVSGQLSLDQATSSTSHTLHVRRTDREGTRTLADVTTAGDGSFSFRDVPSERGPNTYTVSFDGTATNAADRAVDRVYVPIVAWDIDGNDVGDLVTGGPGEDVGTLANAGMFWHLKSTATGITTSGARGITQAATETGDRFGSSTTSGDFNADGYADVAVGAPTEDADEEPGDDSGQVQVFYGSPTGLMTSRPDLLPEGAQPNELSGAALATGDFNGDAFADLAIGAHGFDGGRGRVYVFPGSTSGIVSQVPAPFTPRELPQGSVSASNPGERFGAALAAGDTNGDGLDDLAIGIPQNQQERTYATGAVIVVTGDEINGLTSANAQLWQLDSAGVPGSPSPFGSDKPNSFGDELAFGDYDGDGFDDLAIGVPGAPVTTSTGKQEDAGLVTMLRGSSSGLTPGELLTQQTPGVPGTADTHDLFGSTMTAGDSNADGDDELVLATPGDRLVTLLVGSTGPLDSAGYQAWTQNTAGVPGADEAEDKFGAGLRMTRYNGSGASSLLIGAPGENSGAGALVLLYSNGTGITTTGARLVTQDTTGIPGASEAGDQFGSLG